MSKQKSQSFSMAIDPLSAVTSVGQTVSNIIDQGKRRQFEQALQNLSLNERIALDKEIAKQTTQTARLNMLAAALSQSQASKQQKQVAEQRNQLILIGILVAAGVVTLGLVLYFKKKK